MKQRGAPIPPFDVGDAVEVRVRCLRALHVDAGQAVAACGLTRTLLRS